MTKPKILAAAALIAATTTTALLPTSASADNWWQQSHNQQTNKNNWRNLGYLGAAVGIAGLVTHNNTLAIAGAAGAAYSGYRYEQERHSQSQEQSYWQGGYNGNYDNSRNGDQYHRHDANNGYSSNQQASGWNYGNAHGRGW